MLTLSLSNEIIIIIILLNYKTSYNMFSFSFENPQTIILAKATLL